MKKLISGVILIGFLLCCSIVTAEEPTVQEDIGKLVNTTEQINWDVALDIGILNNNTTTVIVVISDGLIYEIPKKELPDYMKSL